VASGLHVNVLRAAPRRTSRLVEPCGADEARVRAASDTVVVLGEPPP
jgi:hypothetical protein